MRFSTAAGAYEIDSLPSQPQVANCHGFFIHYEMRGMGHAHQLKRHQMFSLKTLGYDFATCTVCSNNTAQKQVLERAGWSRLGGFTSSKTGDPVDLWGVAIQRSDIGCQI